VASAGRPIETAAARRSASTYFFLDSAGFDDATCLAGWAVIAVAIIVLPSV
jgi:hypothetical protein